MDSTFSLSSNGICRTNILTALAEDALGGMDLSPLMDIAHHINIHRTGLIASAAFGAFLTRGAFSYYSNRRRDFHDQRNWTEDQTKCPPLLEKVGENDGTCKIEDIANQKPMELPPFSKSLVNMERHIIVTGMKEHKRNR